MPVTVQPTADLEFIHRIMRHPDIYPSISDDSSPKDPSELDGTHYFADSINLEVDKDGEPVGAIVLHKEGDRLEAHTMLLKSCRGRSAIQATKSAIDWVFGHTDYKEITSYAFSDAPHVSWLARMAGMKETGKVDNATTRNGISVDKINFSLIKT
jgi:RimJ/RimL family protein N-acetyltransferase